jgi:hypothetical protein
MKTLMALSLSLAVGLATAKAAEMLPSPAPAQPAACRGKAAQVALTNRPGLCPRPLGTMLIAPARHVART